MPAPQNTSSDPNTPGAPSYFGGGGAINSGSNGGDDGTLGSGGGGGSCTGSSNCRLGQGGFAGGYSKKTILASALSVTETVTIGAGGAGGAGTAGGAGGAGGAGIVIVTEYYS